MTRRFAVVGTGARAETFIRSLVTNHADEAELVALADVNPAEPALLLRPQVIPPASRVATGAAGTVAGLYPGHAGGESGWSTLTVRPYWSPPRPVELNGIGDGTTGGGDPAREAHGGGDERMTAMLFSGNTSMADPLGRRATEVDGAWALLTGLAANASARERRPVAVSELVDPTLLSEAKQ